jgi:hypothetical protein
MQYFSLHRPPNAPPLPSGGKGVAGVTVCQRSNTYNRSVICGQMDG